MKQPGLKILLAAIVAFTATPAMAGTQTGGPGIQQGPNVGIGTSILEKPDLVARLGGISGKNGLFLGNVCSTYPIIKIDARERLRITSKGELVFRFTHPIKNRGLRPAKNFMSRLRTLNLGDKNTVLVQTVANLNPGEKVTQTFELPFFLKDRNIVDLEFTVNYNNRVRERTMSNNTCRITLEFTNDKYDFAIQSFRFNRMAPTCVAGQPVYYFDVSVKNKGSGWLNNFYPHVSTMPLTVEDLHEPFHTSNPYPGWGAITALLSHTDNVSFKPGETKHYQIKVPYYQNNPDHMRRGRPTHSFQASIRGVAVKSATLSIQSPTACRGGQPVQLKGVPARSKSKKSAPRATKILPTKLLPR